MSGVYGQGGLDCALNPSASEWVSRCPQPHINQKRFDI